MRVRFLRASLMPLGAILPILSAGPAEAQNEERVERLEPIGCGYAYLHTDPDGQDYSQERFTCSRTGTPGSIASLDPRYTRTTGVNAVGIGARVEASGDYSTAYGNSTVAAAANSVAIGSSARVLEGATDSIALGTGSLATQANTVSIGAVGAERRIVNVAAGSAPTDAVNMTQLNALAFATSQEINVQQGQINTLFDLSQVERSDTRQGIAAAMALASPSMPSAPGRTSYAFNLSTFRGEQAVAGSIMHRLDTAEPLAVTIGFSYAGNRNNGGRVGVAGEF